MYSVGIICSGFLINLGVFKILEIYFLALFCFQEQENLFKSDLMTEF